MDDDVQKKQKKKRGRKPKNILNQKSTVPKKDNKIIQNLIIKLETNEEIVENISGYGDEIINHEVKQNEEKSEVCWNCCHNFMNSRHGLPLKYKDGIFYTYGDFCSPECSLRYASENFNEKFFEISPLINLYNNVIYKSPDPVTMAPNKLLLKIFGGNLTIDEYREKFKNNDLYDIKLPPILPIKHNNDTYEVNNNVHKGNLKLFRKKDLQSEKKSITNSMNLIFS
tara:strand:- start:592 stop:1269 length:678 start_codon:yes stop_codon:yes gene_type:complete